MDADGPFSLAVAPRSAWASVLKIAARRSLRAQFAKQSPAHVGDCFVLKDAGAIAHYAPRNDIFMRRGAAAGMGDCPEKGKPRE
jgi:hypothetical protein